MNNTKVQDINLFCMELLHLLLYWIAARIPLNNNIWIFGSWFGETYNDNSRYLFEYVNKNFPDITAVWLSRNKKVVEILRKRGYKAYHFYDLLGIWYALRSGIAIFCVGYTADIPGFCISSSKKLIQLWHGIGTKKVGIMNTKAKDTNQRIFPYIQNTILVKIILRLAKMLFDSTASQVNHLIYKLELFSNYTYFIALSPAIKKMIQESFDIPKDQAGRVPITGIPRNDVLFDKNYPYQGRLSKKIHDIHKAGGSVGFYTPTHRQEGSEAMLKNIVKILRPYQKDLQKKNIYLLVKLHQLHGHEASTEYLRNIVFVKQEDLDGDVYPLLPMTDFLITDYSTIYIDYLLLDKPIIFLIYDLNQYIAQDRELYFPYDKVTPGPKVTSWEQLIPAISRELKQDTYKEMRQKIRKMFHTYSDGNSSKRIAEKIYNEFVD